MERYLHLLPIEKRLWESWYAVHSHEWTDFEYDVHVGKGGQVPDTYSPAIKRMAKLISQKRIDVTATRDGVRWIFEVKPLAAMGALGQLLSYRILYKETFGYTSKIELAIVTDLMQPDDIRVFDQYGIHRFIVEPMRA